MTFVVMEAPAVPHSYSHVALCEAEFGLCLKPSQPEECPVSHWKSRRYRPGGPQ